MTPASDKPARTVATEEVPSLTGEGLAVWGGGVTIGFLVTACSGPGGSGLTLGVLSSRMHVPTHFSPLRSGRGARAGPSVKDQFRTLLGA